MWHLGHTPPAQPASLSWSPAEPRQGWPSCLREPWGRTQQMLVLLPGPQPRLSGLGDVMGAVVDGETSHTHNGGAKIDCSPSVSCFYLGAPC